MNAGVVILLTVTFTCCTAQDVLSPPYIDIFGNILKLLDQIEQQFNKFVGDILSRLSPSLQYIMKPPFDQIEKVLVLVIVGPVRSSVNSLLNGTTPLTVEEVNKLRELVLTRTVAMNVTINTITDLIITIPGIPPLVEVFRNDVKALLEQIIALIDEILQALAVGQKRHHVVHKKSAIHSIHN